MGEPEKIMGPIKVLLHRLMFPIGSTLGVAFTSIVKEIGVPGHPKNEGVTVNKLDTGRLEKLLAMNELI